MSNVPKKQNYGQLIVKPNIHFKGNVLDIIQKHVATKTKAKVMKMAKVKNGTVFIKCNSVQDSEIILQTLNSENNDILSAKTCEKNNPQIRITNILSEADNEDFLEDVINRYQLPQDSITILHKYKQKKNKKIIIMQY